MEYGIIKDGKILETSWSSDIIIKKYLNEYCDIPNCYIAEIETKKQDLTL